jgi:hypothetical protein
MASLLMMDDEPGAEQGLQYFFRLQGRQLAHITRLQQASLHE